jgi:hypothetical protein
VSSAVEAREALPAGNAERRAWAVRLTRNVALWAIPVALLWMAITPFYNLFLTMSAERLTHVFEHPAVTELHLTAGQDAILTRADTRAYGKLPYSIHVTDIHFPLILLVALFLATPGVPWKERLSNLGVALLALACFDVLDLFLWVKFAYATQLGAWSSEHYGAFASNFWGLSKHVLDLPVKLALPFALWCGFYLGRLTVSGAPGAAAEAAHPSHARPSARRRRRRR